MKLIPLNTIRKSKNYRKYSVMVDDEDYEYLMQWKWHVIKNGYFYYAIRMSPMIDGKRKPISMHRAIMKIDDTELDIDHKDGNSLNNQKSNLRICNQSQNAKNCKKHCITSSKYKGVSWSNPVNKWRAQVKFNRKQYYLGLFKNEIEAAKAYNDGAIKYFGEFASLNIV